MRWLHLALALGTTLWPLVALAEETGFGDENDTTPPLLHGTLDLSLDDAIRMGLENNLDVQVERFSPLLADFDVDSAWGAFDPTLFGEFTTGAATTPSASAFAESGEIRTRTRMGSGGLRGVLPILGTEYQGRFDGAREKTTLLVEDFSPRNTSGWSLDVTQPVLRDLLWSQPWTQVRNSRLLHASSEEDFRRAVMDEVNQIENAYWSLIAASEALRVANKSLETAAALLDQTRTQYEVGVVSKVEVTEAEAGVSQREVEQIRAENQYRNQQDVLIDLVLGPNLRAASTLELRPTDRPDDFTPFEIEVETAVDLAFENRPEYARAHQEVERGELQRSFARNQMLPELDGIVRYGEQGLSGRPNPRPPLFGARPPGQGDWEESLDDFDDSPQYTIGAKLSIPFPNTTARANASKREIELTRARTTLRRLEQQIIIEVRQAARNLLASQEGIVAARSAREAAAEQLRAEEIRLEYGESTPFDVLQREEDLVERERQEIDAFQSYRNSVTALDRAQGTILRNRNIEIAEVSPLR